MGLSNQERFAKIAYSISGIKNQSTKLKNDYRYARLRNLCDQLWVSFLGARKNCGFWIFGGGFDCSYFEGDSLLGLAMKEHVVRDEEMPPIKEGKDVSYKDSLECMETIDNMLRITTLSDDSEISAIIEINQWIENSVYALNRYEDEFSKELREFNKVICDIQGELFEIFSSNSDFYKVWLLKNIINKCVNIYSREDFVAKWVRAQNMHHDFRMSSKHDLAELQEVWFNLQPKKSLDISAETRLLILMAIAGRSYHYDHKFKELSKMIEAHNEISDDKISIKKAKEVFEWCKEQKKKGDESFSNNYKNFCFLSEQEV